MNTSARKRYPSDLTDLQWENIEHQFPRGDGRTGRPRTYPLREALPAVFGLGEAPGEEALAYWLPDVWQERQRAAPATAPTPAEWQERTPV